jgi:hypothetical protein
MRRSSLAPPSLDSIMRPAAILLVASAALALGSVALAAGTSSPRLAPKPPAPDFNRDVRPILSRHCFKCHGPDDAQRQAKLRLDRREAAIGAGMSGRRAIVPGQPDQSELVRRIHLTGGGVMPPTATQNPLTAAEKQLLSRWIAAGAVYQPHWAFVPPKQSPPPAVKMKSWPRNAIDRFVLARLESAGLAPSPEADRYTLVRRVYLDLIGLPPTPEEADIFVNDRSADAYEKLVDRLLASPHYGERWARRWLDLARYADTNGYEKDRPRSIWPYRDWVINALNADMPFDRFTVEQLAGDMLPNATVDQWIATGFHRNTMLNEEGGIDPLEFRFHAMVDRVATTGTVWMGMTVGCAQCHTHKFDPIPQREYYQLMACLNNADELTMPVPRPDVTARRHEIERMAAALEVDLPNRFPVAEPYRWDTPSPVEVRSAGGAKPATFPDGSVLVSGPNPETDSYTVVLDSDAPAVAALRLEALTDASLGNKGPGRTPHGNFVLSELTVTAAPKGAPEKAVPVKLVRARADFSQAGFSPANATDGDPSTGWAIHGPDPWNVNRTASFDLASPTGFPGGTRWTITLDQRHGSHHTLGRFRLSLGVPMDGAQVSEERRRTALNQSFDRWKADAAARAVRWTVLTPLSAKSNMPLLTVQADGSVLASGDQTKRDVYDLRYRTELRGITALRLEVLPDPSLPKDGPGRIYYEGPFGDFFLSELALSTDGQKVDLAGATQSFGSPARLAIDGLPQTGWSVNGGQGRAHTAVYRLAQPLTPGAELALQMVFEQYYSASLGRFRVSVTTDPRPAEAALPAEVEALLTRSQESYTAEEREKLFRHFLSVAPELAAEREEIRKLRAQAPELPTTLVFSERPPQNPRPTFIQKRGEFLQPLDRVEPAVLSVLPTLPAGDPANRLTFARWLVSPSNPLTARVTVNRQWAAFFGKGIVRTTEDFGYQGEPPTHPELLDWLAVELMKQGWSLKKLHRLIVTSATYRQSARVTDDRRGKDPQNRLLSHFPRVRLEAELIRDSTLRMSGLLSEKLGGPSVFPPQPPSVTSEGTYGGLSWTPSAGEDRYRRGLYTFSKRTAPFAQFITFDAPSGEACVARREVSNTPLQALTLLNDTTFVEAAQALGKLVAGRKEPDEARAAYLFRRCLTRPPSPTELAALLRFYQGQRTRLEAKELDPAAITGERAAAPETAAWTLAGRALLNLDETVTRQ